jgi:hypothetical protein
LKSHLQSILLGRLTARKETRPTLFERSEFVGRPKRGLAALEMGCRAFKAFAPARRRVSPRFAAYILPAIDEMPNHDLAAWSLNPSLLKKIRS